MVSKARHIWRKVSENAPDLSKGLILRSAEDLLSSGRCSAPSGAAVLAQRQPEAQPGCSGSVGTRSLPEEFAQKVKPILDPFDALLWRPLVCVCLLLCWWP